MFIQIQNYFLRLWQDLAGLETEVILLAMLVIVTILLYDSFTIGSRKISKNAGIGTSQTISIDGTKSVPVREYVSEIQGLYGRPDALLNENGFFIPVERKPLARKIRDRYVAQLLIYMRLIEEFEGKKPPYGYLILGSNCRRIKIENSPSRQAWLQEMLDQMRSILKGAEALATPHPNKCAKCEVRGSCKFMVTKAENPVVIQPKNVVPGQKLV